MHGFIPNFKYINESMKLFTFIISNSFIVELQTVRNHLATKSISFYIFILMLDKVWVPPNFSNGVWPFTWCYLLRVKLSTFSHPRLFYMHDPLIFARKSINHNILLYSWTILKSHIMYLKGCLRSYTLHFSFLKIHQ